MKRTHTFALALLLALSLAACGGKGTAASSENGAASTSSAPGTASASSESSAPQKTNGSIVGTWGCDFADLLDEIPEGTSEDEMKMYYDFHEDGTCVLYGGDQNTDNGLTGTYTLEGSNLTIRYDYSGMAPIEAVFDGKTVTIDENSDSKLVFTRK